MKLTLTDITPNQPIPDRFAFGAPAPASEGHIRLSDNRNPGVQWSSLPEGTRSLVLICVDPDVPGKPDDVNKEGREVPAELERVPFYHWVMVDIPPDVREIREAACSDGITARGKRNPPGPSGARQGLNGYTDWFAGDADMSGKYFGYDGPCPPWNDARVHHYHFKLFATDLARCPVEGEFTGPEVEAAIASHVLGEAEVVGTYTLNPRLR
ncbi:MAG TPA: YbhB/YbcL family Raf kinase inhibitor-like protein [Gammaproteobacteria bacterium]|jgi:Raf kinase inhibitor-like YbhB/YbcL family protein|nr:YbhB/YbcL family Raf kinase inhibitor-like protein [Gammaproteobacteria bacterium]